MDPFRGHVAAHLGVHALGRVAQGQLPQGQQVALAEEVVPGVAGLIGKVDLPLLQADEQLVRREVHQLDFVGPLQHRVGHVLPHDHAGDLGHHVLQAVQVLDVQGAVDVDARLQKFQHVLPALGMPRPHHVRVGQFVHEDQARAALQGRSQVEFRNELARVRQLLPGQHLQPFEQGGGFAATVGLDHADDHLDAFGPSFLGLGQHGVGLSHAGRGAEEHLQLGAPGARLLFLHLEEQLIRIGSAGVHGPRLAQLSELRRPLTARPQFLTPS